MFVWMCIAAAWLAATLIVTLAFYGAKRSRLLGTLMFGEKPAAEVLRITRLSAMPAKDSPTRLAA